MTGVRRFIGGLPIRQKLVLLLVLTSGLALIFSTVVFTVIQLLGHRNEEAHEASTLANLVSENARLALLHGDWESVAKSLKILGSNRQIVSAAVYGADGAVIASYVRAGEVLEKPPQTHLAESHWEGDDLVLFRPILADGLVVGSIHMKTDLQVMYERLMRQALVGAAVMLASFFVALILSARVRRDIYHPIQNLADAVKGIARDKTLGPSSQLARQDELGLSIARFTDTLIETQRRAAALHQSEQYHRSLVENTSGIILLLDRDGTLSYASPSVESVLGFSAEELIGRPIFDLIEDGPSSAERHILYRSLQIPGTTLSQELRFRHKDDSWRMMEVTGSNLLDDPAVAGIVMNFRDITVRKQAERELRDSEQRYRRFVEHAADAFFLNDMDGRILDVNQRACDSLGYARDELLSMTVPEIDVNMTPEDLHGILDNMIPGIPITLQSLQKRKDGSTLAVEVRVGVFESSGRKLVVALARDMTERDRVEAELREARDAAEAGARAKSQFLANMSHEIRTPMNAVIGMAELLQRTALASEQRRFVDIIRNSADALLSVIDDVLDLSKIESGKLTLQTMNFDLHKVLEGSMEMVAQVAQEKGLELASVVEPNVPTLLRGDPGRLRQVLINLLGDAVKFTERGNVHVRVSLAEEGPETAKLRISVNDTGIGIPDELKGRLFQPFVQGDASTTRTHGGVGLGLAISKGLVEMMRGSISVESELGKGTTFWVEACFDKQPTQAGELPAQVELADLRALVVDDNTIAREYLVEQLAGWGIRASACAEAGDALEALHRAVQEGDAFQLAIIDSGLPGADGETLAREIKNSEKLRSTRLVLLKPLIASLDSDWPRETGIEVQLAKPVKQSQLLKILTRLVSFADETEPRELIDTLPARAPLASAESEPLRVLVAEDNPINREVALLMLRQIGCQPCAVSNGVEALDALGVVAYDVVLMDCQMPLMDGYEATAEIRRREGKDRHTTVVAMTAHALEGDRERCLAAGMDDCLFKPVTEDKLVEILKKWRPGEEAGDADGPEVPDSDEQVLDAGVWEVLKKAQAAGNRDFIARLVDLFMDDTAKRLVALRAASVEGDLQRLAKEAHALKGGCRQIGASGMERMCAALETAANVGDGTGEEIARSLVGLAEEFQRVGQSLLRVKAEAA